MEKKTTGLPTPMIITGSGSIFTKVSKPNLDEVLEEVFQYQAWNGYTKFFLRVNIIEFGDEVSEGEESSDEEEVSEKNFHDAQSKVCLIS